MTFGEHLEELRACLFKAIVGLVLGCLVGLAVGGYVTRFIQKPVLDALAEYYEDQAATKAQDQLEQFRRAGYDLPGDLKDIKKIMVDGGLTFEEVYVNPQELRRQLQQGKAGQPALPAPPAADGKFTDKDLVPIFLWRRTADDPRSRLNSMSFQEPFTIYLKASLLAGVILASPWVFYQIWTFVAAGLYPRERRYVHIYLPFSVALFLRGGESGVLRGLPARVEVPAGIQQLAADRSGAAVQRVDGAAADDAVGVRHRLPVAAGHAVPGADRRGDASRATSRRGGSPSWPSSSGR